MIAMCAWCGNTFQSFFWSHVSPKEFKIIVLHIKTDDSFKKCKHGQRKRLLNIECFWDHFLAKKNGKVANMAKENFCVDSSVLWIQLKGT